MRILHRCGFGPYNIPKNASLFTDQPSIGDISRTIETCDERIRDRETDKYQQDLAARNTGEFFFPWGKRQLEASEMVIGHYSHAKRGDSGSLWMTMPTW